QLVHALFGQVDLLPAIDLDFGFGIDLDVLAVVDAQADVSAAWLREIPKFEARHETRAALEIGREPALGAAVGLGGGAGETVAAVAFALLNDEAVRPALVGLELDFVVAIRGVGGLEEVESVPG